MDTRSTTSGGGAESLGRADAIRAVATVWDDRYCTNAAATNSTTKQAAIVRRALAEGLISVQSAPFDAPSTWLDIGAVHDPAYVEAVRTGEPRRLAESQGFSWSPQFADAVARIRNGHLAACRLALSEGLVCHPVSGAHHAGFRRGSGYCTFNFLVGAARALLRDGLRSVAVVDLDAHQGNGTFELATLEPRMALFDIAGAAWITVTRTSRMQFHLARSKDEYTDALDRLPAFLESTRPDLVQYQAGVDCYEDDPVGGIAGVDADFLRARDVFVVRAAASRGIPLVINLAGGYLEDGTSDRLHVQTIRAAAAAVASHGVGDRG